jgi:GNAT superfamily N-acetyltransferase
VDSLIGLVRNKGNKEIVAIGTYMESEDNRAEVAFVVRYDFQRLGVASFLLGKLEKIAIENGYKGFSAYVLAGNRAMLHAFHKRYPDAQKKFENGDVVLYMDFKEKKTGYESFEGEKY